MEQLALSLGVIKFH